MLILLAQFQELTNEFFYNQLTPSQQQEYDRCLDGTVY
jgi:hypothetical protein